MFDYQPGKTPLQARNNMPFGVFLIILIIIFLFIAALFFLFKKLHDYHKSEKYIQKEKERLTSPKDLSVFAKNHNLESDEVKILNLLCKNSQIKNINYSIKNNNDLLNIFKNGYNNFIKNNSDEETISLFFKTLYNLEQNLIDLRILTSSVQIPAGTTIFYLTDNLEKLPFSVVKQSNDALYVEIPNFLYNSSEKPKPLDKLKFNFKTQDGLSYNFISRAIRYDTTHQDHIILILSHSEKLSSKVQRHYKRDYCNMKCHFSPIVFNTSNNDKNNEIYKISDQKYNGKLSNISAGGCCIITELPIKEHQYLSVTIPALKIDENFIGIIKKTRRLTANTFALHIQFTQISIASRNKIFEFVYKFGDYEDKSADSPNSITSPDSVNSPNPDKSQNTCE